MLPKISSRHRSVESAASSLVLLVLVAANQLNQQIEASEQTTSAASQHAATTLSRKSIVFDLKTPKVFYCPQEKPSDMDKMIVKAQSLDKLCEFDGRPKPKGAQSDCYNDVDESEFACDEKKRFMIRLDLASEGLDSSTEGIDDLDYILAKNSGAGKNKKKATSKDEKKKKATTNKY